jgi:hypothetical protein
MKNKQKRVASCHQALKKKKIFTDSQHYLYVNVYVHGDLLKVLIPYQFKESCLFQFPPLASLRNIGTK